MERPTFSSAASVSVIHEAVAPRPIVRVPEKVPEWQTPEWKARVEGEARKHFNRGIAGVGGRR